MIELQKTLKSRLDADLISTCGILRICISHRPKNSDSFKPEGEYMLHSWGNEGGQMDIFWGHTAKLYKNIANVVLTICQILYSW